MTECEPVASSHDIKQVNTAGKLAQVRAALRI